MFAGSKLAGNNSENEIVSYYSSADFLVDKNENMNACREKHKFDVVMR
jgi:hypothetical protein